jgi:serine/threonine protein kinase
MLKKNSTIDLCGQSFTVLGTLGEGGAGIVYKIQDDSNSQFALKLLKINPNTEKEDRFVNELNFCKVADCKYLVPVHISGKLTVNEQDVLFYTMPYYSKTLKDCISEGIEFEKVVKYFFQLVECIKFAHELNIFHRDLKPENILYDISEDEMLVADWGVAKFSDDYLKSKIKTKKGTRLANFKYCSPEQKEKNSTVNKSSDVYSLGLILNEMFTGAIPAGTNHKKIASINENYSHYDSIISWMISNDPELRPTATELILNNGAHFLHSLELQQIFQTIAFDLKSSEFRFSHLTEPRSGKSQLSEIEGWIMSSFLLSTKNEIIVQVNSISDFIYRFTNFHPFMDGNKRITYVILSSLLKSYKMNLNATADEKQEIIRKLIFKEIDREYFANWLKGKLVSKLLSAEELIQELGGF